MPAGSGRQGQVHAKVSAMLPPEIIDNPDLSIDEKIGRLRNLDASLRSLYQALYPGETPWDELAEIETKSAASNRCCRRQPRSIVPRRRQTMTRPGYRPGVAESSTVART